MYGFGVSAFRASGSRVLELQASYRGPHRTFFKEFRRECRA